MTQQDIANKFIADNNGKSLEAEDPSALDQCMDEAFKYCDALGIDRATIRHQYAHQIWDQATDLTRQHFDLFANTPDFIPQVGDIAVFKVTIGIPVGHVAIVAPGSDVNNLVTFDQNWDTAHYHHTDPQGNWIPYCRLVIHYQYYGCVGFLRPKLAVAAASDDVLINQIQQIANSSQAPHDRINQVIDALRKNNRI